MKHPLKRKTTLKDAIICIKCFIGCMDTRMFPVVDSEFYKICKKIVKDLKK